MSHRLRTSLVAAVMAVVAACGLGALEPGPVAVAATATPAPTALAVPGVPLLSASGCATPDDVPLQIAHDLTSMPVPTGWFEECRLPNGDLLLRNRTQVVWETDVSVSTALATPLVIRDPAPVYVAFHTAYQGVHPEYGALIAPGETLQVAASVPSVRLFLEQRGTFLWAAGRQLTDAVSAAAGSGPAGLAETGALLDPSTPIGAAFAACMTSVMTVGRGYVDVTGAFEIARMPGLYRSATRRGSCTRPWRTARLDAASHGVTVPRLAATVPAGPVSDLASAQSFLTVAARMRTTVG